MDHLKNKIEKNLLANGVAADVALQTAEAIVSYHIAHQKIQELKDRGYYLEYKDNGVSITEWKVSSNSVIQL